MLWLSNELLWKWYYDAVFNLLNVGPWLWLQHLLLENSPVVLKPNKTNMAAPWCRTKLNIISQIFPTTINRINVQK